MARTALKWITTQAKDYRKAYPSMTWKHAVKKASLDYRSKFKTPLRKKARSLRAKYGVIKKSKNTVMRMKKRKRIGVVNAVGNYGASPGVLAVVSGVKKRRKPYYKGQRVPVKHIIGTIAHHRNAACTLLKHRLAHELVSRELAETKTKKRQLSKKIAKTKREIRSLK